ncbi:P-loop containing nucleoside triphosphate hydrolase [Pleurotus pulmonarius]
MLTFNSTDTFAQNVAPPLLETPDVRKARFAQEAQALETSKRIDAELKAKRIALQKKPPVKVLVLGQSESGKTTTIKNFQMTYARQAWAEERNSWRPIIYLNIVRSVNYITTILGPEPDALREDSHHPPTLSCHLQILLLRLGPIRRIQEILERLLSSATISATSQLGSRPQTRSREPKISHQEARRDQCKDDIIALWSDDTVQDLLARHNVKLRDNPGFFLDDVDRIASRGYEPSDKDIVRARLRTLGVQEYRFSLDTADGPQTEWVMYDVAGCRTQRAVWIPYFTDVTTILFLAPISAFDEWIYEGHRIILFMNKCDLLAKKLKDKRIKVREYVLDFGNRPNDFKTVTEFFHKAFKDMFKKGGTRERRLYSHFTSVVDTKATALTLFGVHDAILKRHIAKAGLL